MNPKEKSAWVESLKVAELKDELKKLGLSTAGLKAVLAERLLQAICEVQESTDQPEAPADEQEPLPAATVKETLEDNAAQPSKDAQDAADEAPEKAIAETDHAGQAVKASAPPPEESKSASAATAAPEEPLTIHALIGDDVEEEVAEADSEPEAIEPAAQPAMDDAMHAEATTAPSDSPSGHGAQHAAEDATPAAKDATPAAEDAAPAEENSQRKLKRKPIQFQPPERKGSQPISSRSEPRRSSGAAEEPAPADTPRARDPPAENKSQSTPKEQQEQIPAPAVTAVAGNGNKRALYIGGLMRPFTEGALRQLLGKTGTVTDLWMPSLKTHAVVVFETEEQAEATRQVTHQLKWPQGTQKALQPRVISLEEAENEKSGGRSPAAAAPVRGIIAAMKASQQAARGQNHLAATAAAAAAANVNATAARTPVRADGGASTADKKEDSVEAVAEPAAGKADAGNGKPVEEEVTLRLEDLFRKTTTKPALYYLPLSDEQVAERKLKAASAEAPAKDSEKKGDSGSKGVQARSSLPNASSGRGQKRSRSRSRERGSKR